MRTLLTNLAETALAPIRRKGWFSGEYVRLGEYMRRAQLLYETGVVLGHHFCERLDAFVQLFSEPGREAEMIASLAKSAADQVAAVPGAPHDLYDLFFKPEVESLMQHLCQAGRTKCSTWSAFSRVAKKKLLVSHASSGLETSAWKGIALGSQDRLLAEKLLASVPEPETWAQLRGTRRSDWPGSPPPPKPIAELESQTLALIRPYVERYRFDLLARLGLWVEGEDNTFLRWRALMSRQSNGT